MKTFQVPALLNETYAEYVERVSSIAWVFSGAPHLRVPSIGTVELDGEQPVPGEYYEVTISYPPYVPPSVPVKTKTQIWEDIKSHRDVLQVSGLLYAGYWFHNDVKSRGQWERMSNRCNEQGLAATDPYIVDGEQVMWKTMSGVFTPVTAGLIRGVVEAMEIQEKRIFKQAEVHRALMNQYEHPETYDFHTGWPDVYPG